MSDITTSPPPSPKLREGLKRSASSYVHDRLEAVRPVSSNKRSRRGSLATTRPLSEYANPRLPQDTTPLSVQEHVNGFNPHSLPNQATSHEATIPRRATQTEEKPAAPWREDKTVHVRQQNGSHRSNDGDSTVSMTESQEISYSRDDSEPVDLLEGALTQDESSLECSLAPLYAQEATARARSTSAVWDFIQPHMRILVRQHRSRGLSQFSITFEPGPNETPDMPVLEVLAFNQILQLHSQRTLAGQWWKYVEKQCRTSRRRYHVLMAILIYAVGVKMPTQCTNCQNDGLPGCYALPGDLMQPELAQVVGSACSSCIIRKKKDTCNTRHHCTSTPAPQKSDESQTSAPVPCPSDHTLPVDALASPAPRSHEANVKRYPPKVKEYNTFAQGINTLARAIGTFKTVEDQREFIASMVLLLETPEASDDSLMLAVVKARGFSKLEREEIISGLLEWLPMDPVKRILGHLIDIVGREPEELQFDLAHAVIGSLRLPDTCNDERLDPYEFLLGPHCDRKLTMQFLESFQGI